MEIKHVENTEKGSFNLEIDGEHLGEIEYVVSGPAEITIYHTGVNEKLRGQKAGDRLVAVAVGYARAGGLKIVPTCTFAKKVIDRTPEYQDVIAN